jgi:WD40 repeat protein
MKAKLDLYRKKSDVERVVLRNEHFLEWFKVCFIFGRRAEQIRNNLKFDKYDRLIYSSGHAVVIVDPETNMKEFLYVKEDPIHCLQEVTAL